MLLPLLFNRPGKRSLDLRLRLDTRESPKAKKMPMPSSGPP